MRSLIEIISMERVMKTVFAAVCLLLFFLVQSPASLASDDLENRAEADRYYQQGEFKKAYKIYFKLAKKGNQYAQGRVSRMYSRGEGRKIDFSEAYAWSVLAGAGAGTAGAMSRDELLAQTDDPAAAQKKAGKLEKKYGKQAIAEREMIRAERTATRRSGACMGSNLSCSR
jgi:TPR repeat protein